MNLISALTARTKVSQSQEGNGFIKDKMASFSRRVSDIMGKFYEYSIPTATTKQKGFTQGIVGAAIMGAGAASASASMEPLVKPEENIFVQTFAEKSVASHQTKKLDAFHVPRVSERDIERPLELGNIKQTNMFLKSMELPIVRKTKAYTPDGKYAEPILKGTKVMLDATKPILIARDGKTYAYISGHNSTGADVIESLLIRTPWLDDKMKPEKVSKVAPKKNFFEGHFGYKNIIPPAALEKATKEYLANELAKIVQANIAKTDTAIMKTREEIKTEVLTKGKSIAEIPSYHEQKKALSKKYSLTKVNQAIQLFTANGSDALVNPDVEQLLASLKKTPKWQEIIQAATAAENAKIRKRYRG